MQNLDRFIDVYDRVMPRWLGELLIAAVVIGPALLIIL